MQQKYRIPQPVPMMQRLAQLSQFRGHRKEHHASTTTAAGDRLLTTTAIATAMEGTQQEKQQQQQEREESTRTDDVMIYLDAMLCCGWMRLYMILYLP